MALRASRLGELRVRLLSKVLAWSTRAKYRALLAWRVLVLTSTPAQRGWSAGGGDEARLHELLEEVATMKQQVAAGRTPSRTPGVTPGRRRP